MLLLLICRASHRRIPATGKLMHTGQSREMSTFGSPPAGP
jgi:hypothetical protein